MLRRSSILKLEIDHSISPSSKSPLCSSHARRSPDITGTSSDQMLVFVIDIFLCHLVEEQHATQWAVASYSHTSLFYLTQKKKVQTPHDPLGWTPPADFLFIALPDVQGLQQRISRVVGFLNCHGHNSNFRVVQVETVQKISRACRPLSRQTSESLYKKAENELLIFVLFPPCTPAPSPALLSHLLIPPWCCHAKV